MRSWRALATMLPGSKFGLDERFTYFLKSLCENDSHLCGGRGHRRSLGFARDDKGEGSVFVSVCLATTIHGSAAFSFCHPDPDFLPRSTGQGRLCAFP
jgi:hypothetical protein